ncbi:hypothetical protein QZH41_003708 [Actinostola sp. cb2023]|nr:hypothetical protein QZH41_003708 [Actinostola sp. cb2023]
MSEETEHNSPRLSPRETRECSYSRTPEEDASSSVFVDNNRITQRPGITVKNNLLSPPKTLSCLEGRKVNIEFKIFDQRTLRRVERLKNLRTDEKKLVKDIYFPKTQGGKSQNVIQIHCAEMYNTLDSSNHSNASKNKSYSNVTSQAIHRNSRKYTEKRVFELPKVERYDILTPRNIISSDACHVFKEKAVVDTSACLNAHNDKRALHDGVDNLAWDATLASESATFAQSLAQNNQFQHSDANGAYGENLYYWAGASSDPSAPGVVKTCADAVAAWYGEISLYNFDNPGFNQATGHFTQFYSKYGESRQISRLYDEEVRSSDSVFLGLCNFGRCIGRYNSEIGYYDFNNPESGKKTGHFTQVVWKSSIRLGVGRATLTKNRATKTFIVASHQVVFLFCVFDDDFSSLA